MRGRKLFNILAMAIVGVAGAAVSVNGYELARWTVDSGGAMRSSSAGFELSGTIGQPDAGEMAGGGLELVGGFWFGEPAGDCDATGIVDLFDYEDFFSCQGGPGAPVGLMGCDCLDLDGDQDVDLQDFAMLMEAFEA